MVPHHVRERRLRLVVRGVRLIDHGLLFDAGGQAAGRLGRIREDGIVAELDARLNDNGDDPFPRRMQA